MGRVGERRAAAHFFSFSFLSSSSSSFLFFFILVSQPFGAFFLLALFFLSFHSCKMKERKGVTQKTRKGGRESQTKTEKRRNGETGGEPKSARQLADEEAPVRARRSNHRLRRVEAHVVDGARVAGQGVLERGGFRVPDVRRSWLVGFFFF